ncbi:type VI secretion system baseplate subunit TssK [Pseudomonas sp. NA-150]|uniref:type VI secretion system baseplate subunit TssK n=1 Tax=Pseudomonas sp. NA-150 TaxID=3367525 RepID=UPI0037CC7876
MNAHKVIWREGMLLRPQHFQHNDRYHDHQMKTRTQLLGRFTWGFLELEIAEEPLRTGKLILSRASGILPDGSLFDLTGRVEALSVQVPPNVGKTEVYLALPLMTGNYIEARSDGDIDVLARYTIYDANIDDSNAGEGISSIVQCGRPDLRLVLGEQQNDQVFVKLKVGEIIDCSADKGVALNKQYYPTFIHTHSSQYLTGRLEEAASLLGTRAVALAERISSNGKAGGSEVGDFMLLQLMNRTQLVLIHYLKLQQVHPEELFRTLLALIGDLSTFASGNRRPSLELEYLHSDQGTSFSALMIELNTLMSMVLEEHATALPLTAHQYGVQVAVVGDHQHFDTSSFVLVAGAACSPEDLRARLISHLKIGTVETIRDLVNLHLSGFKVRALPVAPRQIAFHSNKAYFTLDLTAQDLEKLKASGGFAFHMSGEISGLGLEFWAIRK